MTFIKIILIPLAIGMLVQFLKMIPEALRGNFRFKNVLDYGGMPSGHSALVASLCTMVGIVQGIDTVEFGIVIIVSVIVIRDSVGLRRIIGRQGKMINKMNHINENVPALQERVGHSPLESLFGILVGVALSYLLNSVI